MAKRKQKHKQRNDIFKKSVHDEINHEALPIEVIAEENSDEIELELDLDDVNETKVKENECELKTDENDFKSIGFESVEISDEAVEITDRLNIKDISDSEKQESVHENSIFQLRNKAVRETLEETVEAEDVTKEGVCDIEDSDSTPLTSTEGISVQTPYYQTDSYNSEENNNEYENDENEEDEDLTPLPKISGKQKGMLIGGVGAILVTVGLLFGLFGYNSSSTITVVDFENKPLTLLQEWANKNKLDLIINYEETSDYANDVVIDQLIDGGQKINKGSKFEIKVSKSKNTETQIAPTSTPAVGIATSKPATANPSVDPTKTSVTNEDVKTLIGKTKKEAQEWAKTKSITISFVNEYSDVKEKDKIMKVSDVVTKNNKNSVTVTISLGTIVVPDFIGKSIDAIEEWIKTANNEGAKIQLTKTEVENNEAVGIVVKQSHVKAELKIGGTIDVEYSKGKFISIKDFTNKSRSELESWAKENSVTVTYTEAYSDKVSKDSIIYQSVTSGSVKELKLNVTVSLGKFTMPDYRGKTESDVRTDLQRFAGHGVDVSLIVREVESSSIAPGVIVEQSYTGATLTINITKAANTIEVPYMIGMTVEQVQQLDACRTNFQCSFKANNPDKMQTATTERVTSHTVGNFVQGSVIDIYFDYVE